VNSWQKSAIAVLFSLWPITAGAAVPSYAQIAAQLPEIWQQAYPVENVTFKPLSKQGVWLKTLQGQTIYYYRFQAEVPRLVRAEDGGLRELKRRQVELWVRYTPGKPYLLDFYRQDLLPGSGGRWLRL
jgi:hypothetical protein